MSRRPGLAVLAGVNAVAAIGGAVGLVAGLLSFGDRLDARLPLDSRVLAGVALGAIVAAPLAALAVLAWRGDTRTGPAAQAVGVILIGWIAIQLAFLRELSFFHPTYVAIGVLLVWLGRRPSA